MNSEYCVSCGAKAYFEVSKPQFCPKCGKPFNQVSSLATSVKTKENQENEETPETLPKVTKSNAKIIVDIDTVKPMTLKDHWLNALPNEEKFSRPAQNGLSVDTILNDVRSSCAPIKQSKEI